MSKKVKTVEYEIFSRVPQYGANDVLTREELQEYN